MKSIFKKRDLIFEGIETFRENSHKEKIYFGIFVPDSYGGETFYGEIIHCRDLERLTGVKVDYLNQWIFIFNFNRRNNQEIDNFYRFEESEMYQNFKQISESRFMTDISPSWTSKKISNYIREMISIVYNVSKNKSFLITMGVLEHEKLPTLFETDETKLSDSFVWGNLDI